MIYSITKDKIKDYNETEGNAFPKYTSQIMNLANQNAQGTRPRVVGQMSDIFPDFMNSNLKVTYENWGQYYRNVRPFAIDEATDKIYAQIENLREAIKQIDRDMVKRWVVDLVILKTFNGLYVQKAILASLADRLKKDYRLASPEEEAKGIDGYIGNDAYSIKPVSYKTMDQLPEVINAKMIYYTKTPTGITIEVEDPQL